ncbi:MAG: hypothetical protein ACRDNW_24445 [Trebonia sp.]
MSKTRQEWQPGGGPPTEAFYQRVMDELGAGYWNLRTAAHLAHLGEAAVSRHDPL